MKLIWVIFFINIGICQYDGGKCYYDSLNRLVKIEYKKTYITFDYLPPYVFENIYNSRNRLTSRSDIDYWFINPPLINESYYLNYKVNHLCFDK